MRVGTVTNAFSTGAASVAGGALQTDGHTLAVLSHPFPTCAGIGKRSK